MENLFQRVKQGVQNFGENLFKPKLISPIPEDEFFRKPTPTPTPVPKSLFKRVTYYLPTGGVTASGTKPKSGYTAAISPDMFQKIPMGSLIKLPNGKVVRVEDKTNRRLKNTLDIFYNSKDEAAYPKGMENDVPFEIVGKDTSGLKYNY